MTTPVSSPYDIGDFARLAVSFTNSAGAKVDPSSVTLQYRHTRSSQQSYATLGFGTSSLTKAGTGDYYFDLAINSATLAAMVNSGESFGGEWRQRWNGYGDNAAAVEKAFHVNHRIVGFE